MKEKNIKTDIHGRRNFFLSGLFGFLSLVTTKVSKGSNGNKESEQKKKKYAMVIDLLNCTGCGACDLACKNENNVPENFFWASHITETTGRFPNVRYVHMPTLCNHCENAPCVAACPTRAMHKKENNITMHDPNKCIGCKTCAMACPYKVISYNDSAVHKRWKKGEELIRNCTSTGKEINTKIGGKVIPFYNKDRERTLPGIRPKGVVEKCTFCDHRVSNGQLPYCVMACPCDARIFGDLNNPQSEVNKLLQKFRPIRLKENLGTDPSVYYIRDFNPSHHVTTKGEI